MGNALPRLAGVQHAAGARVGNWRVLGFRAMRARCAWFLRVPRRFGSIHGERHALTVQGNLQTGIYTTIMKNMATMPAMGAGEKLRVWY